MPDDVTLLYMISHKVGISPNKYVTTKTRDQFSYDARAALASTYMPIEILADAFGLTADGEEVNPADSGAAGSPGESEKGTPEQIRRASRSRNAYPWYRRVAGRNYTVHNLDTRNPQEFKRATRMLGQALSPKA